MHDFWSASWQLYPAAGFILLGAGLIVAGLRGGFSRGDAWRGGPTTALAYLFLFRRLAAGLAIAGLGVGWLGHAPWLLGASLCIGLGELLETSYYIMVVHWGQRHALIPAGPPAAAQRRLPTGMPGTLTRSR